MPAWLKPASACRLPPAPGPELVLDHRGQLDMVRHADAADVRIMDSLGKGSRFRLAVEDGDHGRGREDHYLFIPRRTAWVTTRVMLSPVARESPAPTGGLSGAHVEARGGDLSARLARCLPTSAFRTNCVAARRHFRCGLAQKTSERLGLEIWRSVEISAAL